MEAQELRENLSQNLKKYRKRKNWSQLIYKLFVPQKLSLQSESIEELKHAVVKTVEGLVHNTLQD